MKREFPILRFLYDFLPILRYVKYTGSMKTVKQNGGFTLFPSKFHSMYNLFSMITVIYATIGWGEIPPFLNSETTLARYGQI